VRKFPVTIVHGVEDKLFPSAFARENRDMYKREGHEVNLLEVCNLGHFWAPNAGDEIRKFFSERSLPTKK
jgi:predicted esterase